MQPYDMKELEERVILVGVQESFSEDVEESLDELAELCETAGALVVGRVIQNREKIHPGTYVGKGKIEELKSMIWELRATGIVCDDELSPAQMKNLQDELDVKVMDRTLIILDIFAARASTSEGKIQVELAQLKYQQTRLAGFGKAMSRLGGGIGTRGPGEKKLEMDRRLIKSRIAQLNRELKDVKKHREVTREQRSRSHIPVAAIVGYTNAGKSTLLNLIPRFYDATDGTVKINGRDIKEYQTENLREHIGVVLQKAVLFKGSIADNLRWGKEDATEQEMYEALDISQAREFVDQKEQRLDFRIEQNGGNLSGGQKQRLTIARALVRKPEILILDDSASALDFATDARLRKAIKENTDNMTVFLVSQRVSTIRNADHILVLDDGKIAGIGTHKELLRNCEVYKQIAASQLSEKELQDGMQSEDRKTEDIKSETIKTEERKEAISAKTAEQEVRSDV